MQIVEKFVDVVVVNWNAGALLRQCIDSVLLEAREDVARVVVVDNASSDGSMAALPSGEGSLEKVCLPTNSGFARACNLGAQVGQAPYLLFLNPDAALHPGCLQASVAFLQSEAGKGVGVCGVKLVGDDGEVERTCARFPTVRTFLGRALGISKLWPALFPPHYLVEFDHLHSRSVDEVMGAYFLVRREVFEALGGFDERYFVYFEELDFALRAHQSGWSTYFLASASAYHKGGGVSSQVKAHRLFYSLRSRMLYCFKHMGPGRGAAVWAVTMLVEPVTRVLLALARRSWSDARNTVAGYRMLYSGTPALLRSLAKGSTHGVR